MSVNRLCELKLTSNDDIENIEYTKNEIIDNLLLLEGNLNKLKSNIDNLSTKLLNKIGKSLATAGNNENYHEIYKGIKKYKMQILEYKKAYTNTNYIQKINHLDNVLITIVEKYYSILNNYNKKIKEDQKRKIKLIDTEHILSDKDIDIYLKEANSQQVIQKMKNFLVEDVILDIEKRHLDIIKLESNIQEIYQMFKDLGVLVDIQQESLNVIEHNINKSYNHVEIGEMQVEEAEQYQKKTIKQKCCMLLIVLGILCAILSPIILSTKKYI